MSQLFFKSYFTYSTSSLSSFINVLNFGWLIGVSEGRKKKEKKDVINLRMRGESKIWWKEMSKQFTSIIKHYKKDRELNFFWYINSQIWTVKGICHWPIILQNNPPLLYSCPNSLALPPSKTCPLMLRTGKQYIKL